MTKAIFCVDTSAWIIGERFHAMDVFPRFWRALLEYVPRIRTPRQARDELGDGKSGLSAWLKTAARGVVISESARVSVQVGALLTTYPKLPHAVHDSADPWVIAHAQESNWVVVSEEVPGTPANPKIPDVCRDLDIECIKWMEMLRRLGVCID